MILSDARLGELIRACYIALARSDLDPRVRSRVGAILLAAQAVARRKLQ